MSKKLLPFRWQDYVPTHPFEIFPDGMVIFQYPFFHDKTKIDKTVATKAVNTLKYLNPEHHDNILTKVLFSHLNHVLTIDEISFLIKAYDFDTILKNQGFFTKKRDVIFNYDLVKKEMDIEGEDELYVSEFIKDYRTQVMNEYNGIVRRKKTDDAVKEFLKKNPNSTLTYIMDCLGLPERTLREILKRNNLSAKKGINKNYSKINNLLSSTIQKALYEPIKVKINYAILSDIIGISERTFKRILKEYPDLKEKVDKLKRIQKGTGYSKP